MAPDRLRALSLRTFKATIVCGIIGILIVLGLPQPGFAGSASATARIFALSGLALLIIAMAANVVSLVTGALAWRQGAGRCPWIVFCAIVLLIPVVFAGLIYLGV